ncbi:MAG: hypothetical protein OEV55_08440 [candidate division Zixibacteria bacterium]|nr:hypothetical protein [candidate division Zixibacteria bacterium]
MRKWIWLYLLILVPPFIFTSCGKLSRTGTAPGNIPPEVFMVNIPPDSSSFSTLAKIYWYGFDQDGFITKYQYMIIPDTGNIIPKSGGYIDPAFIQLIEQQSPDEWNNESFALSLGIGKDLIYAVDSVNNTTGTWDNVKLFASLDTTIYVEQYFFVRAVDDDGATSKIWKPDSEKGSNFRWFRRNNRPPITTIKYDYVNSTAENTIVPDSILTEYCLPETTYDWKGITLSWTAEDPDYSARTQPSFTYSWELLGPFASSTAIDTTKIFYQSWDDTTASRIVDSTVHIMAGLENYPGEDFGWYQFRVRAWDDAFAADPTPACVTFRITKPPFLFEPGKYGRNVLLLDATVYDGKYIIPYRDSLKNFYSGLMQSLIDNDIIDSYTWYRKDANKIYPPPQSILTKYNLAIYYNEGRVEGVPGYGVQGVDTGFVAIRDYLRIGGKVWMIGQNNWGVSNCGYNPIDPGNERSGGYSSVVTTVANYFCGVTGIYLPCLSSSDRNEEMITAEPYLPFGADLPLLEVDPVKLSKIYWYFYTDKPPMDSLKGIPRANWESVWNANYNERLYSFVSLYGTQSYLHGRPVASRAYSPVPWPFENEPGAPILQWRTAEFCFPCLPIQRDDMYELMEKMVNWFLQEGIYP